MKKYKQFIKFTIIAGCIFLTVACDKFLETQSNSIFTEEKAFDNLDFATKSVYGIYNNVAGDNFLGYLVSLFYGTDSDIEIVIGGDDAARRSLSRYKGDEGNTFTRDTWKLIYQTIERANMCIDNIPESPIWKGEYEVEAHRLYAEAKTLRALCYFELIKNWGDVPFSLKSVHDGDNYYQPKTDRDEIYEYLIAELAEIQNDIPWMKDAHSAERVTRGFVKGLRARMALSYAGWSLRNKTLETKRGRHWEEYYKIANQECREIMASGKHEMNPNYENIFRGIHAYQQDVVYGEVLYEIAFGKSYSGRIAQSIGMAHTTNPADPRWGRAGAEVATHPYYFYSFDTKDLRRNVNIELYNYANTGYLGMQRLVAIDGYRPCKWRRSWIDPPMGGAEKEVAYTGVNWPIMRYTDIVLMFAETENEINNGPTAGAKDALASVRRRAFPPELWEQKVTRYIDSISVSKDDFFNALVDERAWEFGGEMIRKQDLVRWRLLGAKTRQAKEENLNIINNDPKWQNVPNYIFWKYNADGYTITILNQDYRLPNTAQTGYTMDLWMSGISDGNKNNFRALINRIADGYDEAKNNHLYPIESSILIQSSGSLTNDQMP